MTPKAKKTTKKQSFSDLYDELEAITGEFEAGDLDLEESIPKFKKAVTLAGELKKRLSEIENEIKVIKKDYDNLDDQE